MFTDENMAAGRARSFNRVGSLMRSKSEGTLIDLDDKASTSDNLNGKCRGGLFSKSQNLLITLTDVLTKFLILSQVCV